MMPVTVAYILWGGIELSKFIFHSPLDPVSLTDLVIILINIMYQHWHSDAPGTGGAAGTLTPASAAVTEAPVSTSLPMSRSNTHPCGD